MNDTLKELTFKRTYDPSLDNDDVIQDFYIPCLEKSVRYDRCSAYFSSAILKQFSKGLYAFYQNHGHARFIFSCEIDETEMQNIISAYKEKMDNIADKLDETLENDFEVSNLSYLIKHNLAEVKIAFMVKHKSALMHIKSGLFEDKEHNKVYFDGSGNETEFGVMNNAEIFHVYQSFTELKDFVTDGESRFERLWNNTYSSSIYTEFPSGKLFEKLISFSREKVFATKEEFLKDQNCIYLDIDVDKQIIILVDYSSRKILKLPMVLKSVYNAQIESVGNLVFFINKLSLHDIRDIIPDRIKQYSSKIVYSDNALDYINRQDLELSKRVKLAESIKTRQNVESWEDSYSNFKLIVQHEMKANLKEQQFLNAFHHLAMKSSMDFSVPGTGKTYISYGLFAYLYSNYKKNRDVNHLVVFGPLNCFKAWKEECRSIFSGKNEFTVFDVTEHRSDFEEKVKNNKYHIYLLNFDIINEKRAEILSQYVIDEKTMLVFDEIHKLKSVYGRHANDILKMLLNSKHKPIYKLALTGTPLPNSYLDLINYIKLLYSDDLNGYLKNFSQNQLILADSNSSVASCIQENLHPLFTRTTKKDLGIYPANSDDLTTLGVIPSSDEIKLFELINQSYQNPLLKFIRLIQASSNPQLLLNKINVEEMKTLYDEENDYEFLESNFQDDHSIFAEDELDLINKIGVSTKTKKTIDLIVSKVKNHEKVIVWCLFIGTIDLLLETLINQGIKCEKITGSDGIKERGDKIDLFKHSDVDVLITNPNTLAESVSLHLACHNAIYLEYGFNLTYLLQSKDRIHRVGLPEGTETNYYFAMNKGDSSYGSIDEKVYERLQFKAQRMLETIESDKLIPINSSSDKDDIIAIIKKL